MRSVTGVGRGVSPGRSFVLGAALLAGVLPLVGVVRAQDQPAAEKSLYHRIGGYDVIAGVVDEFLKGLQADPAFKRFGQGRSENSLMRGRQLIVEQICHLSGGPCLYIGREMKPAHKGLAITDAEWEASGKVMAAALTKFKVSEADQKDFGAMIEKLRTDIVEAKAKPETAAPKPETND